LLAFIYQLSDNTSQDFCSNFIYVLREHSLTLIMMRACCVGMARLHVRASSQACLVHELADLQLDQDPN
jgi:hypothetical protein